MGFVLPPKSAVGTLDPEIAGEGVKVILSDGEQVNWNPPPAKPAIPDWSEIKPIRHYFNRTDYKVFPAWLYHESGEARLVKNADEAAELGVCYREASGEEKGRYRVRAVWDWKDDCKWRPEPWFPIPFDPKKPTQGKNYIPAQVDHAATQSELLRALTAAIASGGGQKPAAMSDADWKDWQQYLAFKKAQAQMEHAASQSELANALTERAAESAINSRGADALGEFAAGHQAKTNKKR